MQDETVLFEPVKDPFNETAWACVVYSLVPYLGLFFIPFGIILGIYGFFKAGDHSSAEARRPLFAAALSILVLGGQLFLWWLLYLVPTLGR